MTHPAYSPDLAPCDFFLFPNVKNRMRGHRFPSPEDAVAAYNEELSVMSVNEWRGCFQKWYQRMQRSIECAGEYFNPFQTNGSIWTHYHVLITVP